MTASSLSGIVSEVLGIPETELNASFFGLGGDSAAAISVVRRLLRTTGIDLDPLDLLTCDSVPELSNSLAGPTGPTETTPLPHSE